ncbi:MAG: hypothetical protein QOH06_2126 [Acidobacteriota bacterium]|jgi:hypothetical protein|nr:hypothetical protein [Acidobacteriota bacterium]
MNVTSFSVRATMTQSVRWKQGAEQEGFASVGSWAARALDAYLQARSRAGRPIPLSWHKGVFRVLLDDQEVHVRGMVSPPFAYYQGNGEGADRCHPRTLVNLRTGQIIATLRTARQCQALASELAPILARDEQAGAPVVARHVSEQA